jgi:hypothetical protein
MSSLVSFGCTLNSIHQQILPLCLPKVRLGYFQARVKGEVWRGKKAGGTADFCVILRRTLSQIKRRGYAHRHPRTQFGNNVFPSKAAYTVALGSYFVEMSTREGRKALVIFSPDPKSLGDIHFMYEAQDEEERPSIQVLQGGIIVPEVGFKCLLQDASYGKQKVVDDSTRRWL